MEAEWYAIRVLGGLWISMNFFHFVIRGCYLGILIGVLEGGQSQVFFNFLRIYQVAKEQV